jgi:hypothetical protein
MVGNVNLAEDVALGNGHLPSEKLIKNTTSRLPEHANRGIEDQVMCFHDVQQHVASGGPSSEGDHLMRAQQEPDRASLPVGAECTTRNGQGEEPSTREKWKLEEAEEYVSFVVTGGPSGEVGEQISSCVASSFSLFLSLSPDINM